MICTDCGKKITGYFYCDQEEGFKERCGDCFEKTPCGRGEHSEDCPTAVVEYKDE